MPTYTNNFSLSNPQGSNAANQIDAYIRLDTKNALDERYEVEHYSLANGNNDSDSPLAQGRHVSGKVGCLGQGDLAARAALTNPPPGDGAIFLCTEEDVTNGYPAGTVYRYTDTLGWTPSQLQTAGTIYADAEEVRAYTILDKAVNPYTLQQAITDIEFVAIDTYDSQVADRTKTTNGTYNFDISLFGGTNLNTEEIRAIYVKFSILIPYDSNSVAGRLYTTYPDGGTYQLYYNAPQANNDYQMTYQTNYRIPINKDQTTLTLTLNRMQTLAGEQQAASFSITGAEQRTWVEVA